MGVREQGGEVSVQRTEVEVSCLPKDLPEYIEVDITDLELNQRLHLTDIEIPEGVELPALVQDLDPSIVTIIPRRREEEDEVPELEEELELEIPVDEEEAEAPAEDESSD